MTQTPRSAPSPAAPTASAEILSRLVQFDTTSWKSNLPLLEWVEAQLAAQGIAAHRVPDETGEKANLIATIGPAEIPGYVLSGHTDVVPVDGQPWTRDPFGGAIAEGRVWGRGASDMKGFIACVMAAVPKMAATPLKRPFHLVFSHDEEIGCIGVRSALREMAGWDVKPLGCFVGEPTMMRVALGHKTKIAVEARFHGRTAHSSLAPQAVNAVEYAARLAAFVSDMGRRFRDQGARDADYDVPHSTAHVGVLHGGTSVNIVPDEAKLHFEIRAIAADDAQASIDEVVEFARATLEPAMQAVDPGARIAFQTLSDTIGLDTAPEHDMTLLAKHLVGRNDHEKVAYGTEGGLFHSMAGVPAVIVGPGDIGRAHRADEYIEIDELSACDAFLDRLIAHCAA